MMKKNPINPVFSDEGYFRLTIFAQEDGSVDVKFLRVSADISNECFLNKILVLCYAMED